MTDEDKRIIAEAAQRRIVKEAIKEWMDEKFVDFGRWTFTAFLASLLGALIYFMLIANGWHHK